MGNADRIYLDSMKTYRWYEDRQKPQAEEFQALSSGSHALPPASISPAPSAADRCGLNSCNFSDDSDSEDDDGSEISHKLDPEGSKLTCGTLVSRTVSPESMKISAMPPITDGARYETTDVDTVQPAIGADERAKRKNRPSRRRQRNRKSPRVVRGLRAKKETVLADVQPACKILRLSFGIKIKGNEKRVLEVRNRLEIDLSSLTE